MGGSLNNYISFFYFFFILERFLNMHNLLESLLAYFRKARINLVYPSLDITV